MTKVSGTLNLVAIAVVAAFLFAACAVPCPAQVPAATKPDNLNEWADGKFLYGTYYYPDHWPEEMSDKDAEMMQAAGINMIKTGEGAWATFEPADLSAFPSIPPPPLARGLQAILRKPHTSLLCIRQVS